MTARSIAVFAVIALAGAASTHALGCATEETILFGENTQCVAGRCQDVTATSSTGGGTDCKPDPGGACSVSFKTDLFDPILDVGGSAKCAEATECHGDPKNPNGDFVLVPGDATASRQAMLDYQLNKNMVGAYVTCVAPKKSGLLCNMFLGKDVTNDYGKCGLTMPPSINNVEAALLTKDQLIKLEDWIKCGAPNN